MLLGFKTRFVEVIENGSKCQTVRKKRKIQPKIGEELYMYTGLRTPNCKRIQVNFKLVGIHKVRMRIISISNFLNIQIWVDGKVLSARKRKEFYINDGFADERDFVNYWLADVKPNPKGFQRLGGFFQLFTWKKVKY